MPLGEARAVRPSVVFAARALGLAAAMSGISMDAAAQPAGFNKADAARQIDAFVLRRVVHVPYGLEALANLAKCSTQLTFGPSTVTDFGPGPGQGTVRVKAIIPMTPNLDLGINGLIPNCHYPGDGRPKWLQGQRLRMESTFVFQRWSSGWKLAP
jgi:hypothetical protein